MGQNPAEHLRILPQLEKKPALSFRYILPGLLFIIVLDAAAVLQLDPLSGFLDQISFWVLAALPWITILIAREGAGALGYRSERVVLEYGWGILFGAIWRGLSLGLNALLLQSEPILGSIAASLASALIIVPMVEETFYRGYLARSLASRIGPWAAVPIQAMLFTLHPAHYSQGFPALLSVFGFGMLAGALILWRRNIWSVLGAHGFANILPGFLSALV